MNKIKCKIYILLKSISIIVIVTFTLINISWANPDLFQRNINTNTLHPGYAVGFPSKDFVVEAFLANYLRELDLRALSKKECHLYPDFDKEKVHLFIKPDNLKGDTLIIECTISGFKCYAVVNLNDSSVSMKYSLAEAFAIEQSSVNMHVENSSPAEKKSEQNDAPKEPTKQEQPSYLVQFLEKGNPNWFYRIIFSPIVLPHEIGNLLQSLISSRFKDLKSGWWKGLLSGLEYGNKAPPCLGGTAANIVLGSVAFYFSNPVLYIFGILHFIHAGIELISLSQRVFGRETQEYNYVKAGVISGLIATTIMGSLGYLMEIFGETFRETLLSYLFIVPWWGYPLLGMASMALLAIASNIQPEVQTDDIKQTIRKTIKETLKLPPDKTKNIKDKQIEEIILIVKSLLDRGKKISGNNMKRILKAIKVSPKDVDKKTENIFAENLIALIEEIRQTEDRRKFLVFGLSGVFSISIFGVIRSFLKSKRTLRKVSFYFGSHKIGEDALKFKDDLEREIKKARALGYTPIYLREGFVKLMEKETFGRLMENENIFRLKPRELYVYIQRSIDEDMRREDFQHKYEEFQQGQEADYKRISWGYGAEEYKASISGKFDDFMDIETDILAGLGSSGDLVIIPERLGLRTTLMNVYEKVLKRIAVNRMVLKKDVDGYLLAKEVSMYLYADVQARREENVVNIAKNIFNEQEGLDPWIFIKMGSRHQGLVDSFDNGFHKKVYLYDTADGTVDLGTYYEPYELVREGKITREALGKRLLADFLRNFLVKFTRPSQIRKDREDIDLIMRHIAENATLDQMKDLAIAIRNCVKITSIDKANAQTTATKNIVYRNRVVAIFAANPYLDEDQKQIIRDIVGTRQPSYLVQFLEKGNPNWFYRIIFSTIVLPHEIGNLIQAVISGRLKDLKKSCWKGLLSGLEYENKAPPCIGGTLVNIAIGALGFYFLNPLICIFSMLHFVHAGIEMVSIYRQFFKKEKKSNIIKRSTVNIPISYWKDFKYTVAIRDFNQESSLGKKWKEIVKDKQYFHVQQVGIKPTYVEIAGDSPEDVREFTRELMMSALFWRRSIRRDHLFVIKGKEVKVYVGKRALLSTMLSSRAEGVLADARENIGRLRRERRDKINFLEMISDKDFFQGKVDKEQVLQEGSVRSFAAELCGEDPSKILVVSGEVEQKESENLTEQLIAYHIEALNKLGHVLITIEDGEIYIEAEYENIEAEKKIYDFANGFLTIVNLSDLHLAGKGQEDNFGSDKEKTMLEVLGRAIENRSLVVINGDMLELWQQKYGNIKRAYDEIFRKLKFVRRIIYIAGNHDEDILKRIISKNRKETLAIAKDNVINNKQKKELLRLLLNNESIGLLQKKKLPENAEVILSKGFKGEGIAVEANTYYIDESILRLIKHKSKEEAAWRLYKLIEDAEESLNDLIQEHMGSVEIVRHYFDEARRLYFEHGHYADRFNFQSHIGRIVTWVVGLFEKSGWRNAERDLTERIGRRLMRFIAKFDPMVLVRQTKIYLERVVALSGIINWYAKEKVSKNIKIFFGHTHKLVLPGAGTINNVLQDLSETQYANSGAWVGEAKHAEKENQDLFVVTPDNEAHYVWGSDLSRLDEVFSHATTEEYEILRNIKYQEQLFLCMFEEILSLAVNKHIKIIFDEDIAQMQEGDPLNGVLKALENLKKNKNYKKMLERLEIVPSSIANLSSHVEKNDNTEVFVLMKEDKRQRVEDLKIEKEIHTSYIKNSDFPARAYYPLAEIVVITLINYIVPDLLKEGKTDALRAVGEMLSLRDINIESITKEKGALVFALLPDATIRSKQELIQKYANLKRFMKAA